MVLRLFLRLSACILVATAGLGLAGRSAGETRPTASFDIVPPDRTSSESPVPGMPPLASETKRGLMHEAAQGVSLASWQRDFMRSLATGDSSTGLRPPESAVSARWTMLTGGPPLMFHSAIYDPVHDQMVVFGGGWGRLSNMTWTLSLNGTPTWNRLSTSGLAAPRHRRGHVAIYDPVRHRMVIFGGNLSSNQWPILTNETWALSLDEHPSWTELTPSGPRPRWEHTAIYDPEGDRMVIFGGQDESGTHNDAWALTFGDNPAWTELTPSGPLPPARARHTAIYDPMNRQMVVFGGRVNPDDPNDYGLADAWALSLGYDPSWTALPAAPLGRYDHAAIYDPIGERMIVSGSADWWPKPVHALSLGLNPIWSELPVQFSSRGHTAVFDEARAEMVVFGGFAFDCGETVALPLKAVADGWIMVSPSEPIPPDRLGGGAIYDPRRDRMVTFGGYNDHVFYSDLWALSADQKPAIWSELRSSGISPSPRSSPALLHDPTRDRMVLVGGWSDPDVLYNDTWALSFRESGTSLAWVELEPSGIPPSPRAGHEVIYDSARDRLVLFGGSSQSDYLNDTWALSLAPSPAWTEITPSGTPPAPRSHAALIYDPVRDRMVVFGGFGLDYPYLETWALSFGGDPRWEELPTSGQRPRYGFDYSAVYDPVQDRMVVFDANEGILAVAALYFAGNRWEHVSIEGPVPTPRQGDAVAYDSFRNRMLVFSGGGFSYGGPYALNDSWALELGQERPNRALALSRPVGQSPALRIASLNPIPLGQPLRFEYDLAAPGRVRLSVLDVAGRRVLRLVDRYVEAGNYEDTYGSPALDRLPSGTYFVRLETVGAAVTRRIVLLR